MMGQKPHVSQSDLRLDESSSLQNPFACVPLPRRVVGQALIGYSRTIKGRFFQLYICFSSAYDRRFSFRSEIHSRGVRTSCWSIRK